MAIKKSQEESNLLFVLGAYHVGDDHVGADHVAVALSSDRWPLGKAKKRARSSRMAWRRLGENFRWMFGKM